MLRVDQQLRRLQEPPKLLVNQLLPSDLSPLEQHQHQVNQLLHQHRSSLLVLCYLRALANQRIQLPPLLLAPLLFLVGRGLLVNQLLPLLLVSLLIRLGLVHLQRQRLQRLRVNLGRLAHLLHQLNH